MPDNGNIIITRTITSANPNESFINGIHLRTVAGMLKIFELVTKDILPFKFIFERNDNRNIGFTFYRFLHSLQFMQLQFIFMTMDV